MKRFLKEVFKGIIILLLLFFLCFLGYIYVPKKILRVKESLNNSSPEEYSTMSVEREEVLSAFDDFILESSTKEANKLIQLIYSNSYKLNRLVLEDIKKEVEDYNGEKLKIWYVYNMGIVAKYEGDILCFDLSTVIASSNLLELADSCNYLFISHGDGDHFSPRVVKRILENSGKIIIQDDTGIFEESIKILVSEDSWENIYNLDNGKEYSIGGIDILGIKTMHRMEKEKDNTWFSVMVGEYNIVHTGDGVLDNHTDANLLGDIDVLLTNVIVVPLSLKDIDANYVIPLHMHELGHNREFLEKNSFSSYFKTLDGFEGDIRSRIYPLMWGEGIEIIK